MKPRPLAKPHWRLSSFPKYCKYWITQVNDCSWKQHALITHMEQIDKLSCFFPQMKQKKIGTKIYWTFTELFSEFKNQKYFNRWQRPENMIMTSCTIEFALYRYLNIKHREFSHQDEFHRCICSLFILEIQTVTWSIGGFKWLPALSPYLEDYNKPEKSIRHNT